MNKIHLILLSTLIWCFSIHSYAQKDSSDVFVKDFNVLITSLKELHPNLYTNISKEDFDKEVETISRRLTSIISRNQAIYIIQELIYKLGNGHAGNMSVYEDLGITRALPFSVYIIEDELFIKDFPSDTALNGKKILSIENTKSKKIIDSLQIFFPRDGNRQFSNYNLQPLFNNLYGAFCVQKDTFSIVTETGLHSVLAARRGTEIFKKLCLDYSDEYFGINPYLNTEITKEYGYFQFAGFVSKIKDHKIEKEFKAFIKELNTREIPNVIIDLRINSGGDPYQAGYMASFFTEKSFRIFEGAYLTPNRKPTYFKEMDEHFYIRTRHLKTDNNDTLPKIVRFESGLIQTKPNKKGYKGQIYIMTGSITHSASTMFCKYLMDQENVTFVGSETTGAINYFWANKMCKLELKSLKTTFAFGMELLELKENSSQTELPIGLVPEIKVNYTIQDLIEKKDVELEWIKKEIGKTIN